MSVLSVTCCSFLSAICTFTLVTAAGCGTDARGVDECRDIEEARCAAAKNCGIISDVPACQRFYRDQCLHGLSVTSPGSAKVQECVATIRAAGACAAQGAEALLSDCPQVSLNAPGAQTACEIIREPERAAECAFLVPQADAGSAGSGGTSSAGSGGATDGGATDGGGADGNDGAGTGGS